MYKSDLQKLELMEEYSIKKTSLSHDTKCTFLVSIMWIEKKHKGSPCEVTPIINWSIDYKGPYKRVVKEGKT